MPMEKSGLEGLAQPWGHVLLARQGLSRQTVIAYLQDIGSFLKFWNEASQGSLAFPGEEDVFLFLAWQLNRGLTARTQARRLSALRSFFDFAIDEGLLKDNPTKNMGNPKLPMHLPEVLSQEEMATLLEMPLMEDAAAFATAACWNCSMLPACACPSYAASIFQISICSKALCG